ncbi:MAG: DNA-3-methyladenine glycosylase I [Rhodospirillales bacterium]|nr:DNA-3-methyladenine glycosylase I [Rhodospirillales bacterium]
MSWYCDYAEEKAHHKTYHDAEYGFPQTDERALFELQCLELNQAGLSWDIILKKRPTLKAAYDNFEVDKVAAYGDRDTARLLSDPGIIRNRLKVAAAIENAKRIQALRDSHGGFAAWIAAHHPLTRSQWTKLFRQQSKFMGGEIVNELLMCIGYLPGAHRENCPIFAKTTKLSPPWMEAAKDFYTEDA